MATIARASEAKGAWRWPSSRRTRTSEPDRRGREGVRPLLVVGAGPDQPDRGRRRRGTSLLGLRREALPRLRLTARQPQHRAPASEDHPGDQGSGRPALHDRPADGERVALAARADARGGDAGRPVRLLLHERRRGGERERRQARAPRHRPQQGHRAVPLVPRRDERRGDADGRPAPLGGRARDARGREDVRPLHVPLPRRSPGSLPRVHRRAAPRGDPRVRGRTHRRGGDSRDGHRHQRDHPPARRLPAGDPRGLRPARDPADPRRGDGGLRADGQVVRLRALGRRAGHHHRGEGHQLGLRPARRDDRPRRDRRPGARPVLPRRADLRRPPARLRVGDRVDRGVPGGGHGRERRRRRRATSASRSAPWPSGIRRSATSAASGASGASSS